MVDFLTQPQIEAALISALVAVVGWWIQHSLKLRSDKMFSPKHQLRRPLHFIGREVELAELKKQLVNAADKHLVLHGIGGVGKTVLGTVLALGLKRQFKDAQLCLHMRGFDPEYPPVKPAEAMQFIIRCLRRESKLPDTVDRLTPIYNAVLNEAGRVLLFLDNVADAEQIMPLLPPANCFLLVTSRAQFSLPGMFSYQVDCLRPEKSQELLLKLAPRVSGNESQAAAQCGHLPHALAIFAASVNDNKLYTVSELLERYRQQDSAPVDAAFQVSYELLSDDLCRRWVLLSIFPASFDLAAAAAVWQEDDPRAAMQSLLKANLVQWNEAQGRFSLHDMGRQFCHDKLGEPDRVKAKQRYAIHFRDVAITAEDLFRKGGENTFRSLDLFDQERVHIETMFEWLCSKQDTESALLLTSLLDIMNHTGKMRFHPSQRIKYLEAQRLASVLLRDIKSECKSIGHSGVVYFDLGDVRKAMEFYGHALAISREIKYRKGEGGALSALGAAHKWIGELEIAIRHLDLSLAIARETGDQEGECSNLNYLAGIYADKGDHRRAKETFEQVLAIGRQLGAPHIEFVALSNLGTINCELDNVYKGISYLEEALVLCRKIGDRSQEGFTLTSLGNGLRQINHYKKAIECYERALQLYREFGNLRGEGEVLSEFAVALHQLGAVEQSIAMAAQSSKIMEATEDSMVNLVRENLTNWRKQ